MRRVWAEIDLAAVRHNLVQARTRIGPTAGVMCTVKADAYGHGAVPVSRCVVRHGARMLGVSCAAEAVELREAGIATDILVLEAILPSEIPAILEHGIIPSVSPPEILEVLEGEAARRRLRHPVHLMVDTGMSRGGIPPEEALRIASRVGASRSLRLVSLATHFACADDDEQTVTRSQLAEFARFVLELERTVPLPPLIHTANSSALFSMPETHFNLVRQGITLYGMSGSRSVWSRVHLRPALSLKTKIVYVRRVPPGTPVGYDHTFHTARESVIATLAAGYEDGLPTAASNRGAAIVNGCRVPIVGRVSMDYATVDVTDVADVRPGNDAILIGRQGEAAITAEEFGSWCHRIPYEVTCGLGRRVCRVYLNADEVEDDGR